MPIKKTPAELDSLNLHEYEGVYRIDSSLFRYITIVNNTLYTNMRYEPPRKLLPEAIDTFFFANDNTRVVAFSRDSGGAVDGMGIIDEGMIYTARKISTGTSQNIGKAEKLVNLSPDKLAKFAGVYWLDSYSDKNENRFTLTIKTDDEKLFAEVGQSDMVELIAVSEKEFINPIAEFQITFIEGENSQIKGCIIKMGSAEIDGIKIE